MGRKESKLRRSSVLDRVASLMSPSIALRRAIRLRERGWAAQAFPLFARAARAGIAEAEYRVGRCYLEGSGVPVSHADGVRWLGYAATRGHIEAQWFLAALCVHGIDAWETREETEHGVANLFSNEEAPKPDFAAGEKWARRAAERGSAAGQAVLAYILTSGPESMRNLEEAHGWYERSATAGCPQGSFGYALSLAHTAKDEKDQIKVTEHVRLAAQAGLVPAIYLLGVLKERGIGMKRDQAAAAQLYRQAAAKGNRSGQANWGRALMWGLGVELNPIEGESWLRRAALSGDGQAAALVGELYVKGGALPPNYAEAAIWFRRAAEAGHVTAARALGLLYLTGAGVARDLEEAANWLRISAEAGDPHARVDYANLLLNGVGDGQPEDLAKARHWLGQAAESGNLVAAFNYGRCLAEGVGVDRDERQAVQWLRRAADSVASAQYWYGRMLVEGRGAEANAEEGRTWIARAAAVGLPDAEAALAEMMVNGRGGPRDHFTAITLFESAAGKGHVGAMFALGALNGGGYDVPVDRAVAQRWLVAAAERGHGEAQKMLGGYPPSGPAAGVRSGPPDGRIRLA
jgi:uncharacterized protein